MTTDAMAVQSRGIGVAAARGRTTTRALLAGGALLIAVTVVLPPSAEGSDLLILGYGAVAALARPARR